MFYSHEILSSTQHGVATIWLAATMARGTGLSKGGGGLKRLSKKAVQEVDVPKACETIINPGAPLALRLQGSLLYGVSRVFSEQCRYVLSDAEKTQSDMMTFFRVLQTNETDPQAGKTKRHLIVLQDDPSFDLFSALPSLDSLLGSQSLVGVPSQGSSRNFSFMTPAGGRSQISVSSGHGDAAFPSLGLPSSSSRPDSYRLPSEMRGRSSPLVKHGRDAEDGAEFPAFEHEALDHMGIDLDFDAQGNLIGFAEDELPPAAAPHHRAPPSRDDDRLGFEEPESQQLPDGGVGQVLMSDEAALADVDASAIRPSIEKDSDPWVKTSSTVTEQASAANKRGRPRKVVTMLDTAGHVSRGEFRAWTRDYVENMDASRKRLKTTTTTPGQARKNAYALLYGNGIAGIGVPQGSIGQAHPLASEFAGQALEAHLCPSLDLEDKRGRRRTSDEAFSQEKDEERNVRQKVDGDAEMGRDGDNSRPPLLDDPPTPEMGMDAAQPLEEGRSSSVMPWSRPGSVAHSARKTIVTPSPLHGRGSAMASIERRSDVAADTPYGGEEPSSMEEPVQASWANASGLDQASQAFLEYGSGRAVAEADDGRRWLDFDDLAAPGTQSRAVAAQAFLHVLSLATKGVVAVKQDGADRNEPFGAIRVGFPPLAVEGHDE
ncbi:hypothetical protein CP533_3722 [Ophiocordyceps camponoti-saundersi (nom. inval.)]|nr:hypothetical protein CP533_3722 [Ophiocordyceps camponoti-saundersi (nom. inval.)]